MFPHQIAERRGVQHERHQLFPFVQSDARSHAQFGQPNGRLQSVHLERAKMRNGPHGLENGLRRAKTRRRAPWLDRDTNSLPLWKRQRLFQFNRPAFSQASVAHCSSLSYFLGRNSRRESAFCTRLAIAAKSRTLPEIAAQRQRQLQAALLGNWSLTDCISFHVMRTGGITRALAYDIHFEQAGFEPLLRSGPPA